MGKLSLKISKEKQLVKTNGAIPIMKEVTGLESRRKNVL